MVLAHVAAEHARGVGQVLRLGPLLPLGLVIIAAAATWNDDWRTRCRRAGAVALIAAGALHLGLTGEHFGETAATGLFFVASSVAEIAAGVSLFVRRSPTATRAAL